MLFSYRSGSPLPVSGDLLSARLLVVARLACAGGRCGIRLGADGRQVLFVTVRGRCALKPGCLFLCIVSLLSRLVIPFGLLLRHRYIPDRGTGCRGDMGQCCQSHAEKDGSKPDMHVNFFP